MCARPLIGLTLDAEPPGLYSAHPWYALRAHYVSAITRAGGLPVALPHEPSLALDYIDVLSALVITGGAFDIDPALYGTDAQHPRITLKPDRTAAELALLRGAMDRDLPVLGICGGQQLLAAALGGSLIQHIPDDLPGALAHEQPNPRHEPGHVIEISPGTLLARILGCTTMHVNSSHHQAVRHPGPDLVVNARAPDGVIEGIEHPGRRFCLGVQWHPEMAVAAADHRIFDALVAACA
jgi:putative glutamine amidotransferase